MSRGRVSRLGRSEAWEALVRPSTRRRHVFGHDYELAGSGLYLPPDEDLDPIVAPSDDKPVGIDLFSGAGGFSTGFKQAGFHMAAATDGWADAACTYLLNHGGPDTLVRVVGETLPEGTKRQQAWYAEHRGELVPAEEFLAACHRGKSRGDGSRLAGCGWIAGQPNVDACEVFYLGDVRALTGAVILDDLGRTSDDIVAVIGGPPCQGFSTSGKREVMDPRNSLVFEFMRLVCEINPLTFVMENVPGIVSMVTPEGLPVLDVIARIAEDGGFGTYDAIKRALFASSGAGAAMRSRPVKVDKEADGEEDDQLVLDVLG